LANQQKATRISRIMARTKAEIILIAKMSARQDKGSIITCKKMIHNQVFSYFVKEPLPWDPFRI